MRTEISRKIVSVLLLCTLILTVFVVNVGAVDTEEKEASISIITLPEAEGISLTLYEIADYDEYGKFILNEDFSSCDVDLNDLSTAEKSMTSANKVADFIKENKGTDLSIMFERIPIDGIVDFRELPSDKMYFVMQTSESYEFKMQPMLICVPYVSDNELHYDVSIQAKYRRSSSDEYKSAVIINKVGVADERLQGAEFDLYKKVYYTNADKLPTGVEKGSDDIGTYYWKSLQTGLKTDKNGQIVIEKLWYGEYKVTETKAPKGYILGEVSNEFSIEEAGTVKFENGLYVKDSGEVTEMKVVNKPEPTQPQPTQPTKPTQPTQAPTQPSTSTSGQVVFTGQSVAYSVVGILIIACGVVAFVSHKKKKEQA